MMNQLTALGYGIVVFGILVGVGSIVLYNFGGSVGSCSNLQAGSWNATAGGCSNGSAGVAAVAPVGTAYTNINSALTNLGSTSGGLLTWLPAVIAISIGLLFLFAFGFGGKKGKY